MDEERRRSGDMTEEKRIEKARLGGWEKGEEREENM